MTGRLVTEITHRETAALLAYRPRRAASPMAAGRGAYNLSFHYFAEFRETLMQEFGCQPFLDRLSGTGAGAGQAGDK